MPVELREVVAQRITDLGLTPYTAAKLTDGAVAGEQLSRYVKGERDMGSVPLGHVLAAIGLEIRPKTGRKTISRIPVK